MIVFQIQNLEGNISNIDMQCNDCGRQSCMSVPTFRPHPEYMSGTTQRRFLGCKECGVGAIVSLKMERDIALERKLDRSAVMVYYFDTKYGWTYLESQDIT